MTIMFSLLLGPLGTDDENNPLFPLGLNECNGLIDPQQQMIMRGLICTRGTVYSHIDREQAYLTQENNDY